MTENTQNEMVVVNTDGELIAKESVQTVTQELQMGNQDTFTSINLVNADIVTKAMVSTHLATPKHRIADNVNRTINVVDAIIHKVKLADQETGELVEVPRTILIDDKGESYVAVSKGIYDVIRTNLFPMFGFPTWQDGLPLEIQQGGSGTRKFLTLVPNVDELTKRNKKK